MVIKGYPDWVEIGEKSVWVSNEALNLVQRIDPSTNQVIAAIKVNAPCAAFAIAFGSVWVAELRRSIYREDKHSEQ